MTRMILLLSFLMIAGTSLPGCKSLLGRGDTRGQANPATSAQNTQAITLEITTHLGDQQQFYQGDEITFLVNLNRDAYLIIFYLDANKKLWQLVPNEKNPQQRFKAGLYLPIPTAQLPYKFVVTPPFGQETLYAFASNRPFPTLKHTTVRNGIKLLDQPFAAIRDKLMLDQPDRRFAESRLTITTKAQLP